MVRRCYELTLESGERYSLRLNSFQLAGYLKQNFNQPAAPIVGVLLAIERLDLLLDLLTRALRGGGHKDITSGELLYDLLVDEGYSTVDFARLVVHIAVESGIIDRSMEEEYLKAVAEGENGALGQARTLLEALNKNKAQAAEAQAAGEGADPTE